MKHLTLFWAFFFISWHAQSQKLTYDVIFFGKKIGYTTVERFVKPEGEVDYKLVNSSEANVLFTKKTSYMNFDVHYKNGMMQSSYAKNVKDGVTEIVTVVWKETKYLIEKGEGKLQYTKPINFSSILLYFNEPINQSSIFSERIGDFCKFVKTGEHKYECKLANGVNNIYTYSNGILSELEMNKGASVFLKLVK